LIEIKKTVEKNHQKVMVVCPSEEFHEVGAIIVTNYFSLAGFDAGCFIDSNREVVAFDSVAKAR
jgi:methanogenic corrinoid protein MtbC1